MYYSKITVIEPCFFTDDNEAHDNWRGGCEEAELQYFALIDLERSPQEARSVLPNSLKTEIVMTANLREWRHFFKLRTANAAHPQMQEITRPLLSELQGLIPVVFDDIQY